ncbi:MAG TPA: translation initiation factor IF-2 [Spirochaetia bacterium]|nr:translation initiation factor IF-2 [Spirochaetia bacterium]
MAEEQEEKKRKATLIKHRKPEAEAEPQQSQGSSEKKKVVIIKKRVVKVKRSPAKASKEEAGGLAASEEKMAARPSRPGYLGSSPREPSPFDRYPSEPRTVKTGRVPPKDLQPPADSKEKPTGQREGPSATRERYQRRTVPQTEGGPRQRTWRPGGDPARGRSAPGRITGDGTARNRTGDRGPRPLTGGRPSETSKPEKPEETKHVGKKFFKAKKKGSYQKKKQEERQEKFIPLKKKMVQRANPVPKEISILEAITVSELARKMNLKASDLISKLMQMGMMVTINQQIDSETAGILADEYGCKVNVVSLYDETVIEEEQDREENLKSRPPIVTVMGHVDHGKTKLLDAIRQSNVVESESGGITQHIGAYTVELPQGKVTFVDTPGHEAFTSMRARGAQITDIVLLVVAANDGVMPQTVEAINHAREAKVPIIVVINKIDLEEANTERVKKQLAEYDLLPEDWGGHTLYCEVSALKKTGIESLLDMILLQSEMLELKANFNCRAQGKVVESKVDLGRGIVSTVLLEKGTLRPGDSFIAGIYPGKVRAIFNDKGERIEEVEPSIPAEILGFTGLPNAGDPFQVTENEKLARQIGLKRQELKRMEGAQNVNKITLDNLYDQIKQGEIKELKVIVKGDVHGSVEALQTALEKLSTDEIRLVVIHASAGAINDNDVLLAAASNALIIGFHVRPTPSAQSIAEREKVEIRKYNIIYDVVDDIRLAMEGLLAPEIRELVLGVAEVRNTFKVPRAGVIAGCYVGTGKVQRNAQAHVIRDGVEIYTGKISSLKRFKEDAREVESGYECGIGIENFNDLKVGDQFEVFEIKEFAKKLDKSTTDAGNQKKEN